MSTTNNIKKDKSAVISTANLSVWDKEIKADKLSSLAATVLRNKDVDEALINRDQYISGTLDLYSNVVEPLGAPITNQKSSGRCWLFAATNVFRVKLMKKYNLDKIQLSPSFVFFYDKLEKANFFLEQMCQTAHEDVDSRIVQHLLTDPICDGGQYDMFRNVVEKYGLVPNNVFPDSFNTLKSAKLNFLITTLLHQYGQELREALAKGQDVVPMKVAMSKEIHRLLVLFLGSPPGPNDTIKWEFIDKDKKYNVIETTPLKFYKEILEVDTTQEVSLLNDPRNDYNRVIKVDRLGNVVGCDIVSYLNVDIDVLAQAAIEKIKRNEAVFFGTHTPIYTDKTSGIMDVDLWDYELIGYKPTQAKADRLRYHQSLMTHAMVLVGVHLEDGKPIRWKVENSWGEDVGQKGYFSMTHEYFKEYVYQVVVNKTDIPDHVKYLDDKHPIVLPPWDPCGALAK
jgi:bleomycin hydrolase